MVDESLETFFFYWLFFFTQLRAILAGKRVAEVHWFPFKVRRGGTSVSSRSPSGPVPLLRRQNSHSYNLKKKQKKNMHLKLKVFLLAAADG